MRSIYLDYNATTPIAPAVREAMRPFLEEHFGDPSSDHALGRACHEAIEDARLRVARLLGAGRPEIFFTASGTESANLALWGTMLRRARAGTGHVIISAFEHPAVREPAHFLERLGYGLTVVGGDAQGVVDLDAIDAALRDDTILVSVMHANHEIGSLQPIRDIVERCHARGVLVHTDAAQSVGKVPARVDALGVDLLSFSGHKVYAPKGIGVLYVRRGLALEPLVHGAGHEGGLRGGTENVPYIVGLGRAAELASKELDAFAELATLRDRLTRQLSEAIGPALSVNGGLAERLPNTLSVNFPETNSREMLRRIPELCASSGVAGHRDAENLTPTLAAIGLPPELARGTVRLSLGRYTTEEEIDRAASLLVSAWEGARGKP